MSDESISVEANRGKEVAGDEAELARMGYKQELKYVFLGFLSMSTDSLSRPPEGENWAFSR